MMFNPYSDTIQNAVNQWEEKTDELNTEIEVLKEQLIWREREGNKRARALIEWVNQYVAVGRSDIKEKIWEIWPEVKE